LRASYSSPFSSRNSRRLSKEKRPSPAGPSEKKSCERSRNESDRARNAGRVRLFALQEILGVAREFFHPRVADGNAEIISRDFFKFMGFVEDDYSAVGKNSGIRRVLGFKFYRQVGEKKMVVDNDDVALGGSAAHFRNEASFILFAFLAKTGVGAGVQFVPERACFGKFGEFGSVAGVGCFLPGSDGANCSISSSPLRIGSLVRS